MRWHYYMDGEESPICEDISYPCHAGRMSYGEEFKVFKTLPPPEFLELFEDKGFGMHKPPMRVCKKCYKKFLEDNK